MGLEDSSLKILCVFASLLLVFLYIKKVLFSSAKLVLQDSVNDLEARFFIK